MYRANKSLTNSRFIYRHRVCVGGGGALFNGALGDSYSASGHTDGTFLLADQGARYWSACQT